MKQKTYRTGSESGRRIGRWAKSSMAAMLRRTAKKTGCRLATAQLTPASQALCRK